MKNYIASINKAILKSGLVIIVSIFILGACQKPKFEPPNVILIMTDDQGIGDLGAHGNPWLKTPNLDRLYEDAFQFTNFHVSPLCTPTRAAIMTGQYPINNGTWATFKGRASLHHKSKLLPEVFQDNGYETAMFGKWHLGDNYPARPTDSGFEYVIQHSSGGVGELSDFWGNDYFNDTYLVNNKAKQFSGYCTDVWFHEAMKYMKRKKETNSPFFVYIPTNAPHSPYVVSEDYSKQYANLEGDSIVNKEFYGMITNIDDNIGLLEKFLEDESLKENTILIFLGDNGTAAGTNEEGSLGYNMGFRGKKHSKYDGGHRVPFMMRWPKRNINGGKKVNDLLAHIDLLPTLAGLCNLSIPDNLDQEGIDFSTFLLDKRNKLPDRTYFVHHNQNYTPPKDLEESCIAKGKWRLVYGNELYNIETDPGQKINVATQFPEVVNDLLDENKIFVDQAKKKFEYKNIPAAILGSQYQDTLVFTLQHAAGDDGPLWGQYQIAEGVKNKNNRHFVEVENEGVFTFDLRRWPMELSVETGSIPNFDSLNYNIIEPELANLTIDGITHSSEIDLQGIGVRMNISLEKGRHEFTSDFVEDGEAFGVYYTYIYAAIKN